jgi:hypothetical protein
MTARTNMMTELRSKALWFAFVVLVTCPAVSVAQDHIIEVSVQNGCIHYKHNKGKGVDGFVLINGDDIVQWSCKNGDGCDKMTINLGNTGFKCSNTDPSTYPPGPLATSSVTCYVEKNTIMDSCQKSAIGKTCSVYTTTVYYGNNAPITDDPEFIVDDNGSNLKTGALGALAVLVLVGAGIAIRRWFGKARTS